MTDPKEDPYNVIHFDDVSMLAHARTSINLDIPPERRERIINELLQAAEECGSDRLASSLRQAAEAHRRALHRPDITIAEEGARFYVRTPYNRTFIDDTRNIPGRVWDNKRRVTTFPLEAKRAVYEALVRAFAAGAVIEGPKGRFTLSAHESKSE